jgi:hypothetical protein
MNMALLTNGLVPKPPMLPAVKTSETLATVEVRDGKTSESPLNRRHRSCRNKYLPKSQQSPFFKKENNNTKISRNVRKYFGNELFDTYLQSI